MMRKGRKLIVFPWIDMYVWLSVSYILTSNCIRRCSLFIKRDMCVLVRTLCMSIDHTNSFLFLINQLSIVIRVALLTMNNGENDHSIYVLEQSTLVARAGIIPRYLYSLYSRSNSWLHYSAQFTSLKAQVIRSNHYVSVICFFCDYLMIRGEERKIQLPFCIR